MYTKIASRGYSRGRSHTLLARLNPLYGPMHYAFFQFPESAKEYNLHNSSPAKVQKISDSVRTY